MTGSATDFAIGAAKAAAILDARTAMFKRGTKSDDHRRKGIEFLTLKSGGERYALPLSALAAVVTARPLGRIVTHRREIIGTLYERADVWPVYSLSALLGADAANCDKPGVFLLLRRERRRVALAADSVEGLEKAERANFTRTAITSALTLVSEATSEGLMLIEESALWRHPALTQENPT